jgi:hypothetical protein
MRIERWWWLAIFCVVSLGIHVAVAYRSRTFGVPVFPKPTEIEVALEPLPEPKPEPPKEKKPEPKPKLPPPPKPKELKPERKLSPVDRLVAKLRVRPPDEVVKPKEKTGARRIVKTDEPRPTRPNAEPGGVDPLKEEKPLPLGLQIGRKDAGEPKLTRMARADIPVGGGGSPAPGIVLGGRGGAPGPEAPPEDILFNGGGAGGTHLPKAAPRIGGGGGKSILSVDNPLAKEAIPEDKPGLGPGLGGGQGLGGGGGVGVGRGEGIGTRLDGKVALATLRSKPGPGIGAGKGSGIGTRPPGGGKGTGAELPGTGGTGVGYGRGSGIGIGNGSGMGIGNGAGGGRLGLTRGIPFGDITGLLGGDPNGGGGKGGGPGGPGRGAIFGVKPGGSGGGGPASIVYVLDTSHSMEEQDKIGRAKAALKRAIGELKPVDHFNIIHFDRGSEQMSETMVTATKANIAQAMEYVDGIEIGPGTNISAAMEQALSLKGITHVFLLSDGEPSRGITNPRRLREAILDWNVEKARILTLALTLGRSFDGVDLLKGIAEDNNGLFDVVNLAR